MRPSQAFLRLVASQRALGPYLRFEVLVPFTVLIFILGGSLLTLPPGPLCDEGMVLFMEGGCDWGVSNIFFFAKVSLLVSANLAMVACWLRPPAAWGGFSLHIALLGLLGWVWQLRGVRSPSVLLIADVLHPVDGLPLESLLDGDVRHCGGR